MKYFREPLKAANFFVGLQVKMLITLSKLRFSLARPPRTSVFLEVPFIHICAFLLLCCAGIGCDETPQPDGNNAAHSVPETVDFGPALPSRGSPPDTLIYVADGGINDSFRMSGYDARLLFLAIELRNMKYVTNSDTSVVEFAELNGRDSAEKVISRCSYQNHAYMIVRQVFAGENVIWNDTVSADTQYRGEFRRKYPELLVEFDEELEIATAIQMRPRFSYSPVPFIDDEKTFEIHQARLIENGTESSARAEELNRFKRYLVNFRGRVLELPAAAESDLLIWYQPWEKFVTLWEPE